MSCLQKCWLWWTITCKLHLIRGFFSSHESAPLQMHSQLVHPLCLAQDAAVLKKIYLSVSVNSIEKVDFSWL